MCVYVCMVCMVFCRYGICAYVYGVVYFCMMWFSVCLCVYMRICMYVYRLRTRSVLFQREFAHPQGHAQMELIKGTTQIIAPDKRKPDAGRPELRARSESRAGNWPPEEQDKVGKQGT